MSGIVTDVADSSPLDGIEVTLWLDLGGLNGHLLVSNITDPSGNATLDAMMPPNIAPGTVNLTNSR